MRNSTLFVLIGAMFAAPAFAGGHGGGGFGGGHGMGSSMSHGMGSSMSTGHMNNPDTHGALVSQTAHDAQASGEKVGPQVREVARANPHDSLSAESQFDSQKSAKIKSHAHPANHGATVSQTAHQAHASGMKVGPQVRTVARSKSQGPTHANARALAAVNGTHGNAGSNSVLGTSTGTSTRHGKGNR